LTQGMLLHELSRLLPQKKNEPAENVLPQTPDEHQNFSLIMPELERLLQVDYLQIKDGGSMDAIHSFTAAISHLGKQSKSHLLQRFSQNLESALNDFDIIRIRKLIAEFPGLVNECAGQI